MTSACEYFSTKHGDFLATSTNSHQNPPAWWCCRIPRSRPPTKTQSGKLLFRESRRLSPEPSPNWLDWQYCWSAQAANSWCRTCDHSSGLDGKSHTTTQGNSSSTRRNPCGQYKSLAWRSRVSWWISITNVKLIANSFWDVKEIVHRLSVGGSTTAGQRLKDFILYQIELENALPQVIISTAISPVPRWLKSQLRDQLPPVEFEEIESGNYFLTLHIVTARKPRSPRAGDLLIDGTREDMTDIKYDQMARGKELKNQAGWKRLSPSETLLSSAPFPPICQPNFIG